MAVLVEWRELGDDVQAAVRWGVAAEGANPLGSRGLMIGVARAGNGHRELAQLLDFFAISLDELFAALVHVRATARIDPYVGSPAQLDEVPDLTANAADALLRARDYGRGTGPIDNGHLLGGILSLDDSRAGDALSTLLPAGITLGDVLAAYQRYLGSGRSPALGQWLEDRLASLIDRDVRMSLSPSVRRALDPLPPTFTASALAAELFRLHPEYGAGAAKSVSLDVGAGASRMAFAWFRLVARLFPTLPEQIHGRVLIAALAEIDPPLAEALRAGGVLAAVEAELREPLPWSARPLAELTPTARRVALQAEALLQLGSDASGDVAAARGAVLFGALLQTGADDATPIERRFVGALVASGRGVADAIEAAASALRVDAAALGQVSLPADVAERSLADVVASADALRSATGASVTHVGHLLAAALTTEPPPIDAALLGALGMSLDDLRGRLRSITAQEAGEEAAAGLWDASRDAMPAIYELAGGQSADLVDPTQGIPLDRDDLGVGDYVSMLASLITDRSTPMPLSIGLFGEWGAGKSYFMGLLRQRVSDLSTAGSRDYCSGVAQIGFNAWHYADSNLWASLADEIFEQLAAPPESTSAQRARLRSELAEGLQRRKELEAATARAQEETARLSAEIEAAAALRGRSVRQLLVATSRSKEFGRQLDSAWRKLGVHDAAEQGELLRDELRGIDVEVDALAQLRRGRNGWLFATLGLLVVVLVALAPIVQGRAGRILGAGGVTTLVCWLAAAQVLLARARSGLTALREIAADIALQADGEAKAGLADELTALRRAEANERVLLAQHDELVARIGELGRELAELSPGQRLYHFITARAASDDYRQHLGLISTVRKDFEQLVVLLKEWRDGGHDGDAPLQIDRIVLYIDDLDRCSPEQVVDVLQAVHLLLALELFVVVVGVDPRWLVRSLVTRYRGLLTARDVRPARWQATPDDYLEKIFNVPFVLPRMDGDGFRRLVERLGGDGAESAPRGFGVPPDPTAPPASSVSSPADVATSSDEARTAGVAALPVEPLSEAAAASAGAPLVTVLPLTRGELDMIAALAPLIETPRDAKRLLNVYRLVRSTRNLSPASQFLGDDGRAGEYEAVIILLGLLNGQPRLLRRVLTTLQAQPRAASWASFAAGMQPEEAAGGGWRNGLVGSVPDADAAAWRRLADGIRPASALVGLQDLTAFQLWGPRIARFSFALSMAAHDDMPAAPAAGRDPASVA